jgi:HTH-type transcriptional regulator/antitoxin HipB
MKLKLQESECRIILKGQKMKDDLDKYIENRKLTDRDFAEGYEVGYGNFKVGVMLKHYRELAGLSQDDIADRLNTKKSVISRIENHAEEVKISTILNYARALDRTLHIQIQ